MDFDPKRYNDINVLQFRDGEELIRKIRDENVNNYFDIILDIGCASGNLTALMHDELNVGKIYALDMDETMTRWAKNYYHDKTKINYLNDDVTLDWDQLSPEIRALEGRVSLIYSNATINMITENRDKMGRNLSRLLASNGRVLINNAFIANPFDKIEDNWVKIVANFAKLFIKIPTVEEQSNSWISAFENAGLDVKQYIKIKSYKYEKDLFENHIIPMTLAVYAPYIPILNLKALRLLANIAKKNITSKFPLVVDEESGKLCYEMNYELTLFDCKKL